MAKKWQPDDRTSSYVRDAVQNDIRNYKLPPWIDSGINADDLWNLDTVYEEDLLRSAPENKRLIEAMYATRTLACLLGFHPSSGIDWDVSSAGHDLLDRFSWYRAVYPRQDGPAVATPSSSLPSGAELVAVLELFLSPSYINRLRVRVRQKLSRLDKENQVVQVTMSADEIKQMEQLMRLVGTDSAAEMIRMLIRLEHGAYTQKNTSHSLLAEEMFRIKHNEQR